MNFCRCQLYIQINQPHKVNELEQSVALIEETAEKGKTTYVHCKAGRTRSATVCCAYLIKVSGKFCYCNCVTRIWVSSPF